MSSGFENFDQYIRWLNSAVGTALANRDRRGLTRAARAFRNAYSLPGYSLDTQVAWFARMLADVHFAQSHVVHEFGMDIEVDAELLQDDSRRVLADAYLSSIAVLSGEADLVAAFSFLVKHQSAQKSLDVIEQRLIAMKSDRRLSEFVFDALRMYSMRDDISGVQLERVRELSRVHFSAH